MKEDSEKLESAKRFEDLWIWREARRLVVDVYQDMKNGDGARDFGFRDQLQRSAVSIMNNIAEGFERSTDTDFARFLDIAKGSCGELRSLYYTAEDLSYIASNAAEERRTRAKKISAGIAGLTRHLRRAS